VRRALFIASVLAAASTALAEEAWIGPCRQALEHAASAAARAKPSLSGGIYRMDPPASIDSATRTIEF
jgi:hypothetical protein